MSIQLHPCSPVANAGAVSIQTWWMSSRWIQLRLNMKKRNEWFTSPVALLSLILFSIFLCKIHTKGQNTLYSLVLLTFFDYFQTLREQILPNPVPMVFAWFCANAVRVCAGAAHLGHPEKEEWSAKSAQRQQLHLVMRQVPLECDINIAVNGCSGYASSTRKGPFMAMLISCSKHCAPVADTG